MTFRFNLLLPATLCCLGLLAPGIGHSQDTSVPESVRQMILQSQEATRFQQMARMQIEVQYREFLNALAGDARHKAAVEAELVAVLSEHAELSHRVANGQAGSSELTAISDYAYLRSRLAPLLSASELSTLDNRRGGPSASQIKQQYATELDRAATALTTTDKELVLNTLINHLDPANNNSGPTQLSVDDLVVQQIQSVMQASTELQAQFSGEKLQDVFNFLNQLQSNLYRNRSMLDGGQ